MADPAAAITRLTVDVRPGDRLTLGHVVVLELEHKTGRAARLTITAPREVEIEKKERPKRRKAVPSMTQ